MEIDLMGNLKAIAKKLPSTERLFGYAWMVSWFTAIWIYHIQLFITGLFCLFLAIVIFNKSEENRRVELPSLFSMDKSARTLTVQKVYEDNLKWDDNEICSGNATFPSGIIKEGDVITNCNGNVAFRYVPTNTLIGAFDFE